MNERHASLDGEGATQLFEACAPLAAAFRDAGFRLYLVGGSVRDLIDGQSVVEPDLDFTTDALPSDTKSLLKPIAQDLWTQGERFGTIAAHIGGRLVEVTTHRAEAYEPESRKPVVKFSRDVTTDLSRRDFTINALAIEVTAPSPELIDPYGGVVDLERRRLATPLTPAESFSDDPLRMMRAARFLARFSLTPDPELVEAVRDMAERLRVVSVERVRDEFDKLLTLHDPGAGLRFLIDNGLAAKFLPELTRELISTVTLTSLPHDPTIRLASLLAASPQRAGLSDRLRLLRSSRQSMATVLGLIAVADAVIHHVGEWTDGDVRRLVHRRLELIDTGVSVAQAIGHMRAADAARAAIERVAAFEDLAKLTVPIGGRDVMDILGSVAGPIVGDAMDALVAHRLEVGALTRDEATTFVRDWASGVGR